MSTQPKAGSENSPYPLLARPEIRVVGGIAHSVVAGPMIADDDFYESGLRTMLDQMLEADADDTVRGHVISFDTGGGFVTAGQLAYDRIKSLTKPSLAHVTYACSAGMMAAIACDEIMGTSDGMFVTGSVGVMTSYPKWYIEYYNQWMLDLYARTSERKNEEHKALVGPEHDTTLTKDKLDELDAAFMSLVKKERKRLGATVTADALSGAVFTGRKGIASGLVDSQGTIAQAIKRINTLSN